MLHGREIVVARDIETWANWAATGERHVARTVVWPGFLVSTVFLTLDHNWEDDGPPLLFETMVFSDGDDIGCQRYSTFDEAERGHWEIVRRTRENVWKLLRNRWYSKYVKPVVAVGIRVMKFLHVPPNDS
jgi:hypothetical protein